MRRFLLSPRRTALFAGAWLSASAIAQPAYMVADLQNGPVRDGTYLVSNPHIVESHGRGYFFQDDGIHGSELWRSDGTALGTYLLRDLCPGLCGSRTLAGFELATPLGPGVAFAGNDGVHGSELWITDGTAVGTKLVRDIRPGVDSSQLGQLVSAGDQLFFSADDGVHGRELWRSDGTAQGTFLVRDLRPGAEGSYQPLLLAAGGHLFFTFYGESSESGLWVSDGTAGGTMRLAALDVAAQGTGKGRAALALPNGLLLFAAAETGSADGELWRSDGTQAGTFRVKDLVPGAAGSSPESFVAFGDELVFEADSASGSGQRALWRSDGTELGTTEIPTPADLWLGIRLGCFATVGETIFFAGSDPAHGLELWAFDGTSIYRVSDIRPGADSSIDYYANGAFNRGVFGDAGGRLAFLADDGVHGLELWTSDGSEAGTERISDLFPGASEPELDIYVQLFPGTTLGGHLVLRNFDPAHGYRLLASDGTAAGTRFLDTIGAASSSFVPIRDPAYPYGQTGSICAERSSRGLVFATSSPDTARAAIWGTDGSTAGTELLMPASTASSRDGACTPLAGAVLFFAPHDDTPALWSTSGTPASTLPVADLTFADPQPAGELRPYFRDFAGGVVFGSEGGLWKSSGSPETTELISSLENDSGGELAVLGDSRIAISGGELHFLDGFPGGEIIDIDLNDTLPSYPRELAQLGPDRLLFIAETAALGAELWLSDGSVEGTQLVREIRPGPKGYLEYGRGDLSDSGPEPHMLGLDASAVLTANDGVSGAELWVSDGTALGTGLLRDIYPGEYPSTPRHFTRLGSRAVFAAEDEEHGLELWVTDGTYPGTALLKDIAPGLASSVPDDLVVRDGVLYFSAWSPSYGREAWKSDGTAAGTLRLSDVAPGPLSSSPQRFARAGNRLYFSATDQIHGYELWAISDDGSVPLFLDGFESLTTARWSVTEP